MFLYLIGGYKGRFEIFDEYKIDEFSNRIFSTRYGEWDPIHGLKIFEKNIWKRRSNLMGHHFRYVNLCSSINIKTNPNAKNT